MLVPGRIVGIGLGVEKRGEVNPSLPAPPGVFPHLSLVVPSCHFALDPSEGCRLLTSLSNGNDRVILHLLLCMSVFPSINARLLSVSPSPSTVPKMSLMVNGLSFGQ